MKLINPILRHTAAFSLVAFLSATGCALAAEATPVAAPAAATAATAHTDTTVYATVNGQPILISEYANAFNATLRQKFYHGQVPEGEFAKVRDLVTKQLVFRVLLLEEAKRRGIVADEKLVAEAIAGYEKQYASSGSWQQNRERLLPGLRDQLSTQSVLQQIEDSVRTVPALSDADVRKFYDKHPELFTEPEKLHLSVIMLNVDPSSPESAWERARSEAQAIHKRLQAGADFAETARIHSSGKEAEKGGDLGYVHRGMLPEALEAKIDGLQVGVPAEPIQLLEGVAVFRLERRQPAALRAFVDVAERARGLAQRDVQDGAWNALQARLETAATIKILGNHLLPDGSGAPR